VNPFPFLRNPEQFTQSLHVLLILFWSIHDQSSDGMKRKNGWRPRLEKIFGFGFRITFVHELNQEILILENFSFLYKNLCFFLV
jgi:hypothetical protein